MILEVSSNLNDSVIGPSCWGIIFALWSKENTLYCTCVHLPHDPFYILLEKLITCKMHAGISQTRALQHGLSFGEPNSRCRSVCKRHPWKSMVCSNERHPVTCPFCTVTCPDQLHQTPWQLLDLVRVSCFIDDAWCWASVTGFMLCWH